ncbi:MAG: hypothetical protein O4861_16290 [Trichodesmium sp. St16_bin4-tuft]|uniref:DUF7734 domain-containing protein n=1 Tax=Trichodesmium erythraeum (strain IMS101) TaxID=203124 RepID=Q10Z36_TRIEI|nr:hypothetical protein [Trichodesmium erythraeum GBRTRLIN201]MCH2048121.1 hypothetical protein [Trichodesmium sp. ALOHA_ZT_67]MCL2927034.1 hypothetical protein [Trichodesmium sp. MAG_R01]MDE5067621.1 hypothetical protein [Trichodesmium sp. St4_bin8_1]MDE5072640.1 hypothetical protein [Trichodesmium sp. St5_bin8]MDE5079768.1 hypothetical protein [Trichodesmium sp. St2_bin6]MDE5090551.1 hypothetical protein [Trichodesmium sp. St18_bin3_1_1]MDE5099806.1 hypothetical protein [Trichodesmium sp. 
MNNNIAHRLEQYTIKQANQVLIVNIVIDQQPDEIAIFKGFSSSLMQPTAFNPDVPVLPETAKIISLDILESPYNPEAPVYIKQGLTWEQMQSLLIEVGL